MESNDVGGIFMGRGMSRASKRAKERQNRSSDDLVMAETNFQRSRFLQVADVRKWMDVWSPDVRSGRKSVNSARIWGSGRPGKVRCPVLLGGPDVRKTPVVRWVGVNVRFQIRNAILGGIWGFWCQN